VELGGNFIDTADVYSMGNSEQIVGEWLGKVERDEMVIATKARFDPGREGKGLYCFFSHHSVPITCRRLKKFVVRNR